MLIRADRFLVERVIRVARCESSLFRNYAAYFLSSFVVQEWFLADVLSDNLLIDAYKFF